MTKDEDEHDDYDAATCRFIRLFVVAARAPKLIQNREYSLEKIPKKCLECSSKTFAGHDMTFVFIFLYNIQQKNCVFRFVVAFFQFYKGMNSFVKLGSSYNLENCQDSNLIILIFQSKHYSKSIDIDLMALKKVL